MNRPQAFAIASLALGLLAAAPARAASLTMVPRATWGATGVPSYMQMYIYVPDAVAAKPPIYISAHSCGSTATGQISNIPMAKAQADAQGFILILPDNPGQNCWDVGAANSLKHDGGGDTQAVAQMIKYTFTKYNADPGRVYIMGGSGGAMLVQAMLAVYPDLIRAGVARAGVAAGCWADGYATSNQWSNNCAGGNTIKTAQQWGDLVRAMYPGYTGHRPRLMTHQGDADTTISYKNTGEAIKEWTNVLGLSMTPTSTDTGYKAQIATYNRQFWKNSCGQTVFEAWTSPGGTHSMAYEEADMLKYFGLNAKNLPDPEMDCTGTTGAGGTGGTGGSTGAGGTTGAGGSTGRGGAGGSTGVAGAGAAGTTGVAGGGPGGSTTTGTGGSTAGTSGTGNGGTTGSAGTTGAGGTVVAGTGGSVGGSSGPAGSGPAGSGPAGSGPAGTTGAAGSTTPPEDGGSGGCSVGGQSERSIALLFAALGIIMFRRRRRTGR